MEGVNGSWNPESMATSQRNHDEQIIDQFTRQAATFAGVASHSAAGIMEAMISLAQLGPDDTVLDVACGPGLVACEIAPLVKRVTGVDFVPAMLQQAEARSKASGIANIDWKLGDGRQLDFPDASFSRVLTRYSFHHFENPRQVLSEMARVCQSGGVVLVNDATPEESKQNAYNEWERLRDPSHATALTPDQLMALGNGLPLEQPIAKHYALDCSLDAVLGASFPEQSAGEQYRSMLVADIGADRLSVQAYRNGSELRFRFPLTVVAWRRR